MDKKMFMDCQSMLKRIETLESIVLPQKPARFIDNGDTVTDTKTGLMWSKLGTDKTYTWDEAVELCMKITGHNDWRLPTIEELFSIVDYSRYNPAIDTVFKCEPSVYWSSTTYAYRPSYAWIVLFYGGYVYYEYKTYDYYVRAVRNIT